MVMRREGDYVVGRPSIYQVQRWTSNCEVIQGSGSDVDLCEGALWRVSVVESVGE